MKTSPTQILSPRTKSWPLAALALCLALLAPRQALALTLNVVDNTGAPVTDIRWLLEEDNTAPGRPGVAANDTISMVIHKSHAPVVAQGSSASSSTSITIPGVGDPASTGKRYALSVLAKDHTLGGANLTNGQTSVTVVLNKHPIPTAQISILAFEDHNPINNVPDATERGLPGFQVTLFDFLGGPMLTDVFGNPLGTTYQTNNAGDFIDENGDPITGPGQSPVVDVLGSGFIYTDANGKALVKNLAMGKYGVQVIPPNGTDWKGGHGSANRNKAWNQTATIEGTLTVDAWVKANEPKIFIEGFGVGTYHAFFGFVNPSLLPWNTNPPVGGVTVVGTNRFNHFGRPPNNQQFAVGPPVSQAWIGLNQPGVLGAGGPGLYAAECDPDTGAFVITNVPPGTYQLVTWDRPLDALFGINTIVVPSLPNGSVHSLSNVLSFRWFGTWRGSVFYDTDKDGFKDPTEVGIMNQNLNLRWRDGTIYQSQVTDAEGNYEFAEVFPFFKWLIAEVDFARYKATGMTAVTDEGGFIPPAPEGDIDWSNPSENVRNPQPQYETDPVTGIIVTNAGVPVQLINPNTGNNLSRTETNSTPAAPLLLEAVHLFLNQNTRIDWGKVNYDANENGGIAGVVGYGTTRAEEDPRLGVIDPWEPGVPRVQVVLYQDKNGDKIIDDLDANPGVTLADIDNYPLGWNENPALKGPEDVDRNNNGTFDPGDAIQIVWTDSWDDSPPTGAVQVNPPYVMGKAIIGNDNYSTWNQTREGVFDGGYAFGSYHPNGMASGSEEVDYLPPGMYIVQTCPPPGYLIQTEESFNVGFGDAYVPSKLLLPPELVGTPANHNGDAYLANILPAARQLKPNLFTVPDELTLFPGEPCAFANQERPIADMKWVRVANGKNAACDFHVYTEVPKSTRVVGFVLNDLTAEFNAASVIYGEKGSPGWLPISFRDFTGREIARTYSDEYGSYEALVPSTYNVAAPMPSGAAPQMLTMVLNDPTMPNPANPANRIPDPNYNPAFATTPWTLHYYPGTFLYADTPIVPIAAFVGGPNKSLDVEPPATTPVITNVTVGPIDNPTVAGPFVPAGGTANSRVVNIFSLGTIQVPNPNYTNGSPLPATVSRNFGFGPSNAVSRVTINGVAIAASEVVAWNNARIRVRVETLLTPGTSGQLMVRRGDSGLTTPIGVTLTRGSAGDVIGNNVRIVTPVSPLVNPLATPIQDAIDATPAGGLVIVPVAPWDYNENPILWKPLRLQGSGLGTVINANPTPAERLSAWHTKAATILTGNPAANDPFAAVEAPGIMVLGNGTGAYAANFAAASSRIDGFQIKGAVSGGGIMVWTEAANLRISNNRIIGNQGKVSGGISIGEQAQVGTLYNNPNILIENNQILQNGGIVGAGGIGIFTGATGYRVRNNFIMGNFTRGSGGGIAHEGRSPGGLIANNVIAFNEVFYGVPAPNALFGGDGGGIFVGGLIPPPPAAPLSGGAGSVTIINNLIQGNLAGAGHGGGIRAAGVNGADVEASSNRNQWYALDILNNVIVNNVAGYGGGGVSLADAARVRVLHNTIARNDSTATAVAAFDADPNVSTPRGAGLVTHPHTAELSGPLPIGEPSFCDPELRNNIFYQNRSFFYNKTAAELFPNPAATYLDLVVADGGGTLHPTNCILTPGTPGYLNANNLKTNPRFASQYFNDLFVAAVIDEAGNNLSVRHAPIGIFQPNGTAQGNYHITTNANVALNSPAINAGGNVSAIVALATDFDREPRDTAVPDIGADEFVAPGASILPPLAPNISVPLVGLPAEGAAPPLTGLVTGPNVAPGPMMAPLNLNPLPGDPLNPLLDPEPLVDSDGDGNPTNDVAYYQLAAGDGWATMADGTDLYIFGFSDVTHIVTSETALATARPQLVTMAEVTLVNGGGGNTATGRLVRRTAGTNLLAIANSLAATEPLKVTLTALANQLLNPNNTQNTQAMGLSVRNALRVIIADLPGEEIILRGIGPKVQSAGMLAANLAAPTMVFKEGQHAYLDLSNVGMLKRPDLFDPHTVHFHGFPQAASIFDGEPMASISIAMGGTLRYYYRIVEPGTYLYHCHVEATEHMQMGMIGNLWVTPKQNHLPNNTPLSNLPPTNGVARTQHKTGYKYAYNDGDGSTYYDVEAALQVTGFDKSFHEHHIAVQPLPFAALRDDYPMINGRGYPDTIVPGTLPAPASSDFGIESQKVTSLVTAKKGQRILLRLSNVSETDIHTITVLGIPMKVVAKDARLLRGPTGLNLYYDTTSVKIGGGETADVLLDTSSAAPGTYLLYGARLNHLSNDAEDYGGLMTEIVITP